MDVMKLGLLLLSMICVIAFADAVDDSKKKGLQVGVKKRIDADKCKIKSRKGDSLHMHYTVNIARQMLLINKKIS